MRNVYEVYIIDPETEDWWHLEPVIAKDETTAKIKAFIKIKEQMQAPVITKNIDEYDILLRGLGSIRDKTIRPLTTDNIGRIVIGNS